VLQPRSSLLLAENDSSSECDRVSSPSTLESDSASNSSPLTPESQLPSPNNAQDFSDYEVVEEEEYSKTSETFSRRKNSEQLCPCTVTTVDDVVFMTLSLGLRHGLSWETQVDILKMMGSIFPSVNIPQSKSTYIKDLFNKDHDINYHIFCDECHSYIGKRENTSVTSMTCLTCNRELKATNPSNSFVTLSIESQLKTFLQDEKFVNNILTFRFTRQCSPGELSDVYDGQVYKNLSSNGGILSSKFNFSYNFFVDGVAYKKSNKSIWPIYLTVNELPYDERSKYLILAGVYFMSKDPNESYFLKPFVQEANKLSSEGITWIYQRQSVNSKVIPLCFVADSVARYQMLNMQSFHAYYGCTFCYQQAESVRGRPKFILGAPAELRTNASWMKDLCELSKTYAHETTLENRVYRGVKGSCNLFNLEYFSIEHVVVDYMHACLQGAVKTHMEFLIEACGSDSAEQVWTGLDNIRMGKEHVVKTIDDRIKLIQFNTASRKKIQLLSQMNKSWKASEFRSWLLFYAIPCLTGLLKEKYVAHLAMLSNAMHLLL